MGSELEKTDLCKFMHVEHILNFVIPFPVSAFEDWISITAKVEGIMALRGFHSSII
jgi:hypothetical protein